MKKRFLMGVAAALVGLVTACEELTQVAPSTPQENLEETVSQNTSSTEPEESSTEEPSNKITKYLIRQGEQHATLTYHSTELTKLKFKALFDSTAIYQTVQDSNQGDINKLYGVSECNSFHQTNSARFGWRWFEDRLEIWAYTYLNGERKFALIDTVEIGTFNEYEIAFKENKYVFRLNDKEVEMDRACESSAQGYKLFPYFGGDETAPHDISIWIEELKA